MIRVRVTTTRPLALARISTMTDPSSWPSPHVRDVWGASYTLKGGVLVASPPTTAPKCPKCSGDVTGPEGTCCRCHHVPSTARLGTCLHSILILITLFWEPVLGKWDWEWLEINCWYEAERKAEAYTPFHLSFIWLITSVPHPHHILQPGRKAMSEASLWNSKYHTNSHLQTMPLERSHAWW